MTLKKVMPEDAPPPYTPSDPLTPASTDASISIEDGRSPQLDPEEIPSYEHSLQQTANFVSAALFFSERPPTKPHGQDDPVLAHTITIYTRSQAKDYSRFPRCWRSRSDEVSSQDWLTFLNYLLPAHLGPASVHPELSRKLRREIERDHKDRCQETDEQRQARLSAVVEEWNQCFFRPRAMDVILVFAPESGIMTISPLCPQCYPSTVRSMPMRHGPHQTISRSQTEPTTSQQFRIPRRPVGGDAANSTFADEETCQSIADTDKEVVDLNQPSTPPRAPSRAFQISSWASALQNWATNISEQAQRYGEQVERQAMAHGRRVENNAESFGRMMEARGRSWEKYFDEQEKKMDRAGEKFEAACDRRSPWLYPWNPSGPWGRHAGGMGSSWGNQCHNGRDQPTSSRRRSASISSLSSFSSSSSSSDSDSVSVCSSDSDDDGVATATGSTCEVNGLREYRIQARNLSTEYRAKAAGLRHELCALRAAHKELKRNSGCGPGRNTLSHAKAAEARAIKIEVLNLRREYKAMRREFHQERKQLRRALRESKKEQRKAKKAERKSQRKNKGKGEFLSQSVSESMD